jgi:hypothetical protein
VQAGETVSLSAVVVMLKTSADLSLRYMRFRQEDFNARLELKFRNIIHIVPFYYTTY